jgi:hypothetical protein
MLKNYINADTLMEVLSGNFELGYTDIFLTEILNDRREVMFSLETINDNIISMIPFDGESAVVWNGKTGFVSDLYLYSIFSPPQYARFANGSILRMVLDEEIYLDVDTFSVDFSSGAISFASDLIIEVPV